MAHSFHSVPGNGNGYPAFPFYSSFPPNPSQQLHTNSPGYQQTPSVQSNQPASTPLHNGMRFESNAHMNTQPAPLPFPPTLNPDSFRHFPPPPPPPPNFSTGPGTPTSFSHFLQTMSNGSQAYAQPPYPGLPQQHPVVNGSISQIQGTTSLGMAPRLPIIDSQVGIVGDVKGVDNQHEGARGGSRAVPEFVSHDGKNDYSSQIPYMTAQDVSQPVHYKPTKPLQPTQSEDSIDNQLPSFESVTPPHQIDTVVQHQEIPSPSVQQVDPSISRLKLKESAKAAILSFVPHKITYSNLLEEGVNPHVLQQLFTELGLSWKPTSSSPNPSLRNMQHEAAQSNEEPTTLKVPQQVSTPQSAASKTSANPSAKTSSGGAQATNSVPAISSGLERKDRIAQLLAAKTGKVGSTGALSQSSQAITTAETMPILKPVVTSLGGTTNTAVVDSPTVKSAKVMAQPSLVRQKMEQLRKETAEKTKVSENSQADHGISVPSAQPSMTQCGHNLAVQFSSLSTPVRESLAQSGISSMIPGLFMTSADEEFIAPGDGLVDPVPFSIEGSTAERILPASSTMLKRPIFEESGKKDQHRTKRQALSQENPVDIDMEVDSSESGGTQNLDESGSEGEIIEDEVALASAPTTTSSGPHRSNAEYSQRSEVAAQRDRRSGSASFSHPPNFRHSPKYNNINPPPIETQTMHTATSASEPRKGTKRKQSFIKSPPDLNSRTLAGFQQTQIPYLPTQPKLSNLDQTVTNDRTIQSPRTLTKLTPAQLAERAAQLKADFIRQRVLRQKQLVEDMPALDNEVQRTQQRLEQNKSKLAELQHKLKQQEAEIAEMRNTEGEVIAMIRNLELQLQDGMSGQKQFSNELNEIRQQTATEGVHARGVDSQPRIQHQALADVSEGSSANPSARQSMLSADSSQDMTGSSLHEQEASRIIEAAVPTYGDSSHVKVQNEVAFPPQPVLVAQNLPVDLAAGSDESHDSRDINENSVGQSTDTDNEHPAGRSPAKAGVAASPEDDHYESEDDEPMDQSDGESDMTPMSVDKASPESVSMNGSASMFDSDSEDYEPASPEPQQDFGQQIANDDGSELQEDATHADQAAAEEAMDDYEPVEAIEIAGAAPIDQQSALASVTGDSIQEQLIEKSINQDHNEPQSAISDVKQTSKVDSQGNSAQLSETETLTKPQGTSDTLGSDTQTHPGRSVFTATRFAPYQSPLSLFKSYRFNPSFASRVQNGYRSLTYSHKIDPKNPICSAELSGEVCTDPSCQEQHFGSMVMADDKILVQMSSANDIKDKGLRDQYLLGLKHMIARMRSEGVRDFNTVGDALSKYRREWAASQTSV